MPKNPNSDNGNQLNGRKRTCSRDLTMHQAHQRAVEGDIEHSPIQKNASTHTNRADIPRHSVVKCISHEIGHIYNLISAGDCALS